MMQTVHKVQMFVTVNFTVFFCDSELDSQLYPKYSADCVKQKCAFDLTLNCMKINVHG